MMQVIEQTHDETVAMYMQSCTKKELAEMLANCNEIIRDQLPMRVIPCPAIQWDISNEPHQCTTYTVIT